MKTNKGTIMYVCVDTVCGSILAVYMIVDSLCLSYWYARDTGSAQHFHVAVSVPLMGTRPSLYPRPSGP